jgi:hypothetical protein
MILMFMIIVIEILVKIHGMMIVIAAIITMMIMIKRKR